MPGQTYRSHDTYRESKTYEGIGPGGGTGPLDSYFLPLSEDRVPNREILAMRGITVPSRRYLQFLKQQVGTDVDGLGGITIGGVHYDGGRWNGPLSAAQIAALGAAGLSGRIVQAAQPGDLPADIGLTKPGGGGSKGGGGGGDKGGGGGGGGGGGTDYPCPGGISIPASIPADESVDVTGALNAFFAALPPNAVVCVDPAAKYRLSGTLVVDLTNIGTLTVNQNGALFHWPDLGPVINGVSTRQLVKVMNGQPLWNDAHLLGPYGDTGRPGFSHTYEGEDGFNCIGTHDAVITRPVIHGTAGDAMQTSKYRPPVGPQVFCTNTQFLFPTVGSCIGGFADAHGSNGPLYIEDGDFRHIARSGLDFEFPSINIHILRNHFADLGLNWVGMAGQGGLVGVEIADNVVEDASLFAKFGPSPGAYTSGQRDHNFQFLRNRSLISSGGNDPVFSLKGVYDVTLIGNVQHYSSPRAAGQGAIGISGTSAPLDTGYYAQDNDFAGAGALYGTPTDPTWIDGGGNIV